MRVFTVLTMQQTTNGRTIVQEETDVIDFPVEPVSRENVLKQMISRMPDDVRDGIVVFFAAEKEMIT